MFISVKDIKKDLKNNKVLYINEKNEIYEYRQKEEKSILKYRINPQNKNKEETHQKLSNNQKYAVVTEDKTTLSIYEFEKKRKIKSLKNHKYSIETIYIDQNDKYLITGGADKRAFVYFLENGQLLYELKGHRDDITAISINEENNLFLTGSFDKTINLYKKDKISYPKTFRGHTNYIIYLDFVNNEEFISVDRNGNIFIFDINSNKKQKLNKIEEEIKVAKLTKDKKFLFIATVGGYVKIYSIKDKVLINKNFTKVYGNVSTFYFAEENKILIGTTNGKVIEKSLIEETILKKCLEKQKYGDFYKEVENNKLLIYTKEYEELEERWKKTKLLLYKFAKNGKKEYIEQIAEPFMNCPNKRREKQQLIQNIEAYKRIKEAYKSKKYNIVYSIIRNNKTIQENMPELEKIEEEFKIIKNKTKRNIMKKNLNIQKEFERFNGVSEKQKEIKELIHERNKLISLKSKIELKNYREAFFIIKQNPHLKEHKLFEQLENIGIKNYMNLFKAISILNIKAIKALIEELKYFEDYRYELEEAKKILKDSVSIREYCKTNNKKEIYKLIKKYNFEIKLKCFLDLQKELKEKTEQIEIAKKNGDRKKLIDNIKYIFEITEEEKDIYEIVVETELKKISKYKFLMNKKEEIIKIYEILEDERILKRFNKIANEEQKINIFILNKEKNHKKLIKRYIKEYS